MSALNKFGSVTLVAAGALFGGVLTSETYAGPVLMGWGVNGAPMTEYNPADFGEEVYNSDGTIQYLGGIMDTDWSLDWDCLVLPGAPGQSEGNAFVDAAIVVTNTSAQVQTFSMLMTLALSGPIGPSTLMDGAVAATVTNNQFSGGATIASPAGSSLYKAFVDVVNPLADVPAATLWNDPFSLSAAGAFASASGSDSFVGTPGPGANSNIAVLLTFTLSPGDTASVSGIFEISKIPAPATLGLFGLALGFGRRRRA